MELNNSIDLDKVHKPKAGGVEETSRIGKKYNENGDNVLGSGF